MRIGLFDYELPQELIAQEPAAERDQSRLLVVSRGGPLGLEEHRFADLPELLRPGDLVVMNDARVLPARLRARRASGGSVELLLLRPSPEAPEATPAGSGPREASVADPARPVWEAMVRPGRRIRVGDTLTLAPTRNGDASDESGRADPGEIEVVADAPGGRRLLAFPSGQDIVALLEASGEMPLPPYIRREQGDLRSGADRERYQTVYARAPGAVAAPTAGLHFTPGILEQLEARGIRTAMLTLRVGPGTFQRLRADDVEDHVMEAEQYVLRLDCVEAIVATREAGGRVVAVGTTVVRTLEHAAREHGAIGAAAGPGRADLFIYPGFEFQVVDAMLTNFHLPRATPILLVAALMGRERLLETYDHAIENCFRFYSYGDAMLVL